jgi:hypothetical protein
MIDVTEEPRRKMVAAINSDPGERAALEAKHGEVYDTEEMSALFEVEGFMAPFTIVRRKADGAKGTMMFQHMPRYYFGFSSYES